MNYKDFKRLIASKFDWGKYLIFRIPAFLIFNAILGLFFLSIAMIIVSIRSQPDYKRNPIRYKRVIKEGIFFDTTEYHER